MEKIIELPEFDNTVLSKIRDAHIESRGEAARKLWENGEINIDFIKECYNSKKNVIDRRRSLSEGKTCDKIGTPLKDNGCKSVIDRIKNNGGEFSENYNSIMNDYSTANDAVMRFCTKILKEA